MKAIGGYYGLELTTGKEFHRAALKLNSGRNALEYIIRANNYKKIYLPYYTCDVIYNTIKKLGIQYEFYKIDENFEPVFNFETLNTNQAFLYTNYMGLKDSYINYISKFLSNLVIDNAQAFFASPLSGIDTFYSPRKFFGVPDGGYLYVKKRLEEKLPQDFSFGRFEHLLRRIDKNAEDGYPFFQKNDENLMGEPLKQMSKLTVKLLSSINYKECARVRNSNFEFLHKYLSSYNQLNIPLNGKQVPMTYPFLTDKRNLREKLIMEKIYTPLYWPNVKKLVTEDSIEFRYSIGIVHLPIDHRYNLEDMNYILSKIKKII